MPLLDWKSEYSVGISSVDHEHREMIAMINALYEKMGEHPDAGAIETGLGEIYAAIAAHFALEERIMRAAKYREYEPHKEDHEELLDQIHELMDQFIDDPQAGRDLLQQRLGDWFAGHFATFDARLHGQLDIDDL